jgi:hypothetical protein
MRTSAVGGRPAGRLAPCDKSGTIGILTAFATKMIGKAAKTANAPR